MKNDDFPPLGPVREATADDTGRIAECIGKAFSDDPLAAYFFPDEKTRARRFGAFSRFVMDIMSHHGAIMTMDPIHGASIWQAPSPPKATFLETLGTVIAMALGARSAFGRVGKVGQLTEKTHPHEPHWYLAILGTEPECQGQGIGSTILRATLQTCDADGVPAYLESSKESNIDFYSHHGFEVTGEIKVPDGPTLWPMIRPPA